MKPGQLIFIKNGLKRSLDPKGSLKGLSTEDYSYKINKGVKNYVTGKSDSKITNISTKDFDKIADYVENAQPAELMIDQLGGSLDPETAAEFTDTYLKATGLLKSKLPTRYQNTVFGPEKIEPRKSEVSKFLRAVNIVDNPLTIFDKIDNNTVLQEEIDILDNVYPEFASKVRESIANKLLDKPTLTAKQKKTLGKLMVGPQQDVAALQQDFVQEEAEQQSSSQISVNMAGSMATDVEKIANK